jgi:integrase
MGRRKEGEIPRLRPHPTGGSVVVLSGESIYCGPFGTPEARRRHVEAIMAWEARGRKPRPKGERGVTVAELVERFGEHVPAAFRKRGRTSEGGRRLLRAAGTLARMFGTMPLAEFRAADIKGLRDYWVNTDGAHGGPRTRETVNQMVRNALACLAWGVEEGLVPPALYAECRVMPKVQRGRTRAAERPDVRAIPDDDLAGIIAACKRQAVADLIRLQAATGMRPCEVCAVRAKHVDRSGEPWAYRLPPEWDKTEHVDGKGRPRIIWLGPAARAVLGPRLDVRPDNPFPSRFGTPLSVGTYHHNFRVACRRAGVGPYFPNQVRHTVATRLRAAAGLEAARLVLGHRHPNTTLIYAHEDERAKAKYAEENG